MLAVQIQRYGPAESLACVDVPTPQPAAHEVLVQVHACGVNRLDLLLREGKIFQVPLPRIPGTDFAGTIVAVGADVADRRVGERVLAAPILSCGQCEHCLQGEDNLCKAFGTVGSTIDGGYAAYVRIPARNARPVPGDLDWITAASFGLTYATASAMLRRGRLKKDETVLVLGSSGGLGYAAVQLARCAGARVIAVCRGTQRGASLLTQGADAVVEPGPRMAEQVQALTGGKGVDLVFEHVAAATFEQSIASLAVGGRLVLGGVTTGTQASLDLKAVFTKRLEVLGCRGSGRKDFDHVLELMARGAIRPHVEHVLALERATEAHHLLESGHLLGKVVLKV
ncbi:zinc-binding dehydrogenase [Ideonella dechloratans]|uniref:Zinc-binding dehydrogenase n=1 Tax=Ideonella dechloratans TaxID=36863 RepID=A0A643FA50_IDEDE|nr:alcohol dehydrogenase catalytic domain-containing protein [Ideonella dechloratans]KAB0573927.1 zinc-binding dehydrogenase [Ideonella dechloratans]UFU12005.1 alcohol dehydrogenase catalytic domain-containing protein [Ideonella dechloratans]